MRGLVVALALLCAPAAAGQVRPVTGFEADRYLGLWHEIASIPAWFQRDCASDVTAFYAPAPEGRIAVRNACRDAAGTEKVAEGRARFTGAPDVAALEVAFVRILGLWLWPIAGDYVVIALDPDYRWSAVAHPSRDYAWILSREPQMDEATLRRIAGAYAAAGYDLCRILTAARTDAPRRPLCEIAP